MNDQVHLKWFAVSCLRFIADQYNLIKGPFLSRLVEVDCNQIKILIENQQDNQSTQNIQIKYWKSY